MLVRLRSVRMLLGVQTQSARSSDHVATHFQMTLIQRLESCIMHVHLPENKTEGNACRLLQGRIAKT